MRTSLTLFVLLTVVQGGTALMCYVCARFVNTTIVDCEGSCIYSSTVPDGVVLAGSCTKYYSEECEEFPVDSLMADFEVIGKFPVHPLIPNFEAIRVCVCNEDKCNMCGINASVIAAPSNISVIAALSNAPVTAAPSNASGIAAPSNISVIAAPSNAPDIAASSNASDIADPSNISVIAAPYNAPVIAAPSNASGIAAPSNISVIVAPSNAPVIAAPSNVTLLLILTFIAIVNCFFVKTIL